MLVITIHNSYDNKVFVFENWCAIRKCDCIDEETGCRLLVLAFKGRSGYSK